MNAINFRPGELAETAQRLGYFEDAREPIVMFEAIRPFPRDGLVIYPFARPQCGRSVLTACIIAGIGKRNPAAQADALAATAYALRTGEGSQAQIHAFAMAAHNLQHAATKHWSRS